MIVRKLMEKSFECVISCWTSHIFVLSSPHPAHFLVVQQLVHVWLILLLGEEGGEEWCLQSVPMTFTVFTSGGKVALKGVHFRTGPSCLLVVGRSIRDAEPVAAPWKSWQNAHVNTDLFNCMSNSVKVKVLMQIINSPSVDWRAH